MTTTTYYYPYQNGGVAAVASPPDFTGVQSITVQNQQKSGYIKVVVDSTTPNQYQVTFNYGGANPITETVYQTRYSTPNSNEVTDGGYNYILSNSTVSTGQTYTLNDTGNNGATQFRPNSAFTTDPVACFVRGTLIATARGDVAVEDLAIGDLVVTARGELRPVRWIGRRSYSGRFAAINPDILPVCLKANALGEAVPQRDLWVSPKHAMLVDDVLVPAEHLVNGSSVVRARAVERVDYFHVELASHDIILAEGAPTESFVDDEGRGLFENAHEYAALYPDDVRVDAVYCAVRVESGYRLEAIRHALALRAAASTDLAVAA